jgi:hypothetical protein
VNILAKIETALPQSTQDPRRIGRAERESDDIIRGIIEQATYLIGRVNLRGGTRLGQRIGVGDIQSILAWYPQEDWGGWFARLSPEDVGLTAAVTPLLPEAVEIDSRHYDEADGQQTQLKFTHV